MLCRDYELRTSIDLIKENVFTLKKVRRRRYSAKNNQEVDYAGDLTLLANTPTQIESLQHSLE